MSEKFMLNGKEYNGSDESGEVFGVADMFKRKKSDGLPAVSASMDDERAKFVRKARVIHAVGTTCSVIIILGCIAANVYVISQDPYKKNENVVIAAFGLFFAVIGVWMSLGGGAAAMKKINHCTKEVNGRVLTFRTSSSSRGGNSYFPIFGYTYNDVDYELKTSYSTRKKPVVGEAVHVFIDPANPKDGYETKSTMEAFGTMYVMGDIFVIIGSVVFLVTHL